MPLQEVERRTMWVSVWHSDMFGRNDFLGEVSSLHIITCENQAPFFIIVLTFSPAIIGLTKAVPVRF
jgi:hypothetical protein